MRLISIDWDVVLVVTSGTEIHQPCYIHFPQAVAYHISLWPSCGPSPKLVKALEPVVSHVVTDRGACHPHPTARECASNVVVLFERTDRLVR